MVALPAGAGAATTYYVRASGDDGNDGLTPATALASVRPAARRLRQPGDRLIVGPGTYHEGNIAPFGNGTPESPIVLSGDPTGTATGDPAGPVLILPPNTPAATSGFYIRGRSDLVIEGFEIAGARDAAIEVRTRARTGMPSTRIALRNNHVRASHIGMQITAAGDVEISGNHLEGSLDRLAAYGDCLILVSVPGGALRPMVTGNLVDDCFVGIRGSGLADGVLAENDIRTRARNLMFLGNQRLTLHDNRFRGPKFGGEVRAADLSVFDNVVEAPRIIFGATGTLEVRRNELQYTRIHGGPAEAVIADNTMTDLFIGGGGRIEIARNEGRELNMEAGESAMVTDNRFPARVKIEASNAAVVRDNPTDSMTLRAGDVTVERNAVTQLLRIFADTAEVADNTCGALTVQGHHLPGAPPAEGSAHVVHDNVVGGPLVGVGAESVRLEHNTATGPIRTIARRAIDVLDNEARGISCTAKASGSQVTAAGNHSRQSAGAGITVIGAESATIADNTVTDSADSGLVVRRVARLIAADNTFSGSRRGGMSVRVPPAGDCNENADVGIGELVTVVGIALQRRPLHECDAADANRDRRVTVEEVVLSVGAALGRPDPLLSTVELRDNIAEDNARFGIDVYARAAVVAEGNRVLRTGGVPLAVHGLGPLSDARLLGNVLGQGGADGLVVDTVDTARIRDNVVFSNRAAGILLRAAPGAVVSNNLVYANGGSGIGIGLDDSRPSAGAVLTNDTLFGNGSWGIDIGSGDVASTGTTIRDNVLRQNTPGGIQAAPGALAVLTVAFNINTDGHGAGVFPDATNLDVDPQLVAPAGADGILGGAGYADDDFHLGPDSPAIDAGSAPAADLGITGAAEAGETSDEGIVDLGYHYGALR